jgi:hypothetical protein
VDGVAHSRAWRFDRFLLDIPNGGLFRLSPEGVREPVVIGSRALDVLTTLVARAGDLVAKQDLMNAVWPGVSVAEAVIVRRLAQAITVTMVDTESARSKQERPTNPDAFDLVLQARSLAMHNLGQRERATRVLLMEQAVQLDPNSIMALTELAGELIIRVNTLSDAGPETLERAAALVRQAAAVKPNDVARI